MYPTLRLQNTVFIGTTTTGSSLVHSKRGKTCAFAHDAAELRERPAGLPEARYEYAITVTQPTDASIEYFNINSLPSKHERGGRGGGRSGELELGVEVDTAPAPDARLSATPPAHSAEARVAALEVLFVGEVQPGPLFMRIAALEGQPGDPPTNLRDALARLGALESMT